MRVDHPLQRRSAPLSLQCTYEENHPLVIIVYDDSSVREALSELILSAGFQSTSFASSNSRVEAKL
ncbi:DNA-binding response regulator, partial [Rhizobium ruizarguesonis]